ncbi:MAG TPA: DUF3570 domain-containing protein [Burkholderiaceae bacterium]|nr:DUF3570 domain-containing protein [Burkholderiaceae bacterium]
MDAIRRAVRFVRGWAGVLQRLVLLALGRDRVAAKSHIVLRETTQLPAAACLGPLYRGAARMGGLLGGVLATANAEAVDLPGDRADAMYHSFIGGGVVANGPAILVRKSLEDVVSLSAFNYVDMVSNASIDVVTTASPYKETRVETGVGLDYVYRDALISLTASTSREPDYIADSASIDVAQDFFGGMTTVSLGYSKGWDTVEKHNDPSFSQPANHWQYRLGATQILTPRWLVSLNTEAIADQGYLQSPYRVARVFGAAVPEVDPSTRTSRAATLRVTGSVGAQGAVHAQYRYFWDTWDIRAGTEEVGYSQYVAKRWLLDGFVRHYSQSHAIFYSDDFATEETYMSRNRQLSTFNDLGLGAKGSYSIVREPGRYEIKFTAAYEWMRFHYDDFTDIRTGKLYSFDANVVELFLTATF